MVASYINVVSNSICWYVFCLVVRLSAVCLLSWFGFWQTWLLGIDVSLHCKQAIPQEWSAIYVTRAVRGVSGFILSGSLWHGYNMLIDKSVPYLCQQHTCYCSVILNACACLQVFNPCGPVLTQFLIFMSCINLFKLLKFICKKGKVFPLQTRLWPRGWVEV